MPQAIVIGAGITGLACAYELRKLGVSVVILDAADLPGGLVATHESHGFLFETGPQCPRFPPALRRLVREVGLDSEFVTGNSRAPRYILKNGKLHEAPFTPATFLATRIVGAGSKYRILSELFRRSQPPGAEESLAAFVGRKFDGDVLDYLVEPFISAIFFGDVEKIGVASAFPFLDRWERQHGSLLRGALKSRKRGPSPAQPSSRKNGLAVTDSLPVLGTFRAGLGTLPKALAKELGDTIRFGKKAEYIERVPAGEGELPAWRVRTCDGNQVNGSSIVITTPANEAGRLLRHVAPDLSAQLSKISYSPLAVVSCGYERSQVKHPLRGFGVMIPRRENFNSIFQVWNSSVFPGRAPANKVLITAFAGGATNPDFVAQDEETMARIVEKEMEVMLGIDGPPAERFVWKHSNALPQFNVGHKATAAAIRKSTASLSGVYLAGNYLDGRSLGECVETATKTAEEVVRQFSQEKIKSFVEKTA